MRLRAWWGRRPWRERAYPNAHALHAFENDVILRKIREMETPRHGVWLFTVQALMNTHPDLFNERNLHRALKRMTSERKLVRPRRWGKNPIYELNELAQAEAKAA